LIQNQAAAAFAAAQSCFRRCQLLKNSQPSRQQRTNPSSPLILDVRQGTNIVAEAPL
jgi:hypothetical protein